MSNYAEMDTIPGDAATSSSREASDGGISGALVAIVGGTGKSWSRNAAE